MKMHASRVEHPDRERYISLKKLLSSPNLLQESKET